MQYYLNFTLLSWHCWIQGRQKEKTQQNQKYCCCFFLILCLHYPKQNSITTISNLLISHHFVADSWLLIGIPDSGCVDITIICYTVILRDVHTTLCSVIATNHPILLILHILRLPHPLLVCPLLSAQPQHHLRKPIRFCATPPIHLKPWDTCLTDCYGEFLWKLIYLTADIISQY